MEVGIRTDDMALATLLAIKGYPYTLAKLTERKAVWDFSCEDDKQEEFDDLIADYQEFAAQVEPRQFVIRFAEMRQELYQLLPRPVRRSGVPLQQA